MPERRPGGGDGEKVPRDERTGQANPRTTPASDDDRRRKRGSNRDRLTGESGSNPQDVDSNARRRDVDRP